jgi:hypothetical protein
VIYLENKTTFSGSDIKVFAYRSISEVAGFVDNPEVESGPDLEFETEFNNEADPFLNMDPSNVDRFLDESLQGVSSGDKNGISTNKVSPTYVDIVKYGSDKKALELARKYQQARSNARKNYIEDRTGSLKQKPIVELGSLYSITYSSFREKNAVRTLGRVSAKGYTRGQRTIAGSMNFTVMQSHELIDFLKPEMRKLKKNQVTTNAVSLLDQLPPFNLMFIMTNEYGGASIQHIFGVTISTESQQSSVEDLALMNNVTFYAEDIATIQNIGNAFETSLSMLHPAAIAGKSLQFYNGDSKQTIGSLLKGNVGNNTYIKDLINRSRGLF